jgi:hypothetical protein
MTAQGSAPRKRRGRPSRCPPGLLIRILDLQAKGLSYRAICALLNAEHVPTPGGATPWYPSHVCNLLATLTARALIEELRASRSQNLWSTTETSAASFASG